jgi:hypothetical protein
MRRGIPEEALVATMNLCAFGVRGVARATGL